MVFVEICVSFTSSCLVTFSSCTNSSFLAINSTILIVGLTGGGGGGGGGGGASSTGGGGGRFTSVKATSTIFSSFLANLSKTCNFAIKRINKNTIVVMTNARSVFLLINFLRT